MTNAVIGWDIGGAHLKAALLDETGKALRVWQIASPLWQGLVKLTAAIDEVHAGLDGNQYLHAVTMTGELADIFPDRKSGVHQITQVMSKRFENLQIYAGPAGFVSLDNIPAHYAHIASANWFASAAFIATQVKSGLFVDLGSTTCDLIPLYDGQVQNRGYSDAERMQYEELVYTGVVRTPLMALGDHVSSAGKQYPLAAEHFATTADVYRLTGELEERHDLAATADGAGKTLLESARRLARMLCRDVTDAPIRHWTDLAFGFRQLQLEKLKHAARNQYSYHAEHLNGPIIGAGAGSFLLKVLAQQLGRDHRDAATFISAATTELSRSAAVCFPAYAVARLAQGDIA
ncbi:MAG TPA: hydantoinase/oxoprolinase family protein [Methylophilaceae bacterium]|nr:hydantoinase/oxoprolinase family protein [Methylophilaceae bacterium]